MSLMVLELYGPNAHRILVLSEHFYILTFNKHKTLYKFHLVK